jgi:hypothetical protein
MPGADDLTDPSAFLARDDEIDMSALDDLPPAGDADDTGDGTEGNTEGDAGDDPRPA